MNLTRALDVALPEIPARTIAEHYPRLDPGATFREHIEDGKPIVRVYVPSSGLHVHVSAFRMENRANVRWRRDLTRRLRELYSQQDWRRI